MSSATVIVAICNAASAVTAIYKSGSVLRIFPAGEAPQGQPIPYATFLTAGGHVENSMDSPSRADNERIQIDAYAQEHDDAYAGARAIRTALEDASAQSTYSVGIRTIAPISTERDEVTRRYRAMFEVSFWTTQ